MPPYDRWTRELDDWLIEQLEERVPVIVIAELHDRSVLAICQRMGKLYGEGRINIRSDSDDDFSPVDGTGGDSGGGPGRSFSIRRIPVKRKWW